MTIEYLISRVSSSLLILDFKNTKFPIKSNRFLNDFPYGIIVPFGALNHVVFCFKEL